MAESNPDYVKKGDLDKTNLVLAGIVVVLFVAFAATFMAVGGMVQSQLASKQVSYEDLKNQVLTQNLIVQREGNSLDNLSSKLDYFVYQMQVQRLPK